MGALHRGAAGTQCMQLKPGKLPPYSMRPTAQRTRLQQHSPDAAATQQHLGGVYAAQAGDMHSRPSC